MLPSQYTAFVKLPLFGFFTPAIGLIFRRGFKTEELLPEGAKAYINGKWINSISGHFFEVKDPYTCDVLADATNCNAQDAMLAVAAATKSFHPWALESTAKERATILQKWYDICCQKESQMSELLTREQGKPLSEAKAEVEYAASFLDWYSGEARRIYGEIVPASKLNRLHMHTREPIGVVGIITPWNFPYAMITRKVGAALAAGCTVVVKPAEDTPLCALALAEAAFEAGIPSGVFNVIPADRKNTLEISKFLCSSSEVDCISFTGSAEVGKIILSQCASTAKRVCLELGGSAPFIVFKSANLDQAVKCAIAAKFRCSGQACIAANRFYIHTSIKDQFVEKISEAVKKIRYGNGMDKTVVQGPLINTRQFEKVKELVDDALNKKANLICGGKPIPNSTLFEPTILTNITSKMTIANSEIFGPIVAIQEFEEEEEVLMKANNTRNCLAGYIFSKDSAQIHRVVRLLAVGMVGVNDGIISCAEAAFGGIREGGHGREGGRQGIDEFTQWKYICINNE